MADSTRAYATPAPGFEAAPVVPTERVIARLRRHGRVLAWPAIALIAISGGAAYGLSVFPGGWEYWAVLGGAVCAFLLLVLWPFVSWLNRRSTITTRRVIARSGFFVRERREIFHSRGYEISTRRGPLQAMSGSADVVLGSGLERPIVLKSLPGAALVVDTLHHLIEKNQVLIGGAQGAPTGPVSPER